MASPDHLQLSSFVKSVHEKLRNDCKILGPDAAWKKHCADEDNLEKYSKAMKELASNHWEQSYKKDEKAISRVEWIYNYTVQYFTDIIYVQNEREQEIGLKANIPFSTLGNFNESRYNLLDVGSCYNPFARYECFNVVPIDIAPANADVYKCDFLTVPLDGNPIASRPTITKLEIESFHVVVFSLFLEYLPEPKQRLSCCRKAYQLLKTGGILCIITPDSKHVGANAKIMKSWRFLLAQIGFSRIKYEKLPYLHCMVFRKSLAKEIAQRWALIRKDQSQFYTEFFIPQDFKSTQTTLVSTTEESKCDLTLFAELAQI